MNRHVIVVGGGISGLATAHALATGPAAAGLEILLVEAGADVGGALRTSPFAGRDAVDESADSFLARVPQAAALARRVGLGDALTSPATTKAAVWHERLHPIPDGLVLGVPAGIGGLATSGLLSWSGRLRAAAEPLLPRTSIADDSIGAYVRARFGDEIHERLVDALIGSIFAAETDRSSLALVPQLAALAGAQRSLLLAARRSRRSPAAPGPIFYAPLGGMGALAGAVAGACRSAGVTIRTGVAVTELAGDGRGWRVDGERADAVVLATPARSTAALLARDASATARLLALMEHAGVVIVTVAIAGWPARLGGMSGYLVPKSVQRTVTAVSFGSQKWPHWTPADGRQVLRISLGRDGLPVDHLDDEALTTRALDEVGRHLALELQPSAVRMSRWPSAFPQYRPRHLAWLAQVDASLPSGLHVTGASYRGIGVASCIAEAEATAARVVDALGQRSLAD